MDVHPTPFPGNKAQPVKSKYKKINEVPKSKIKEAPPHQRHRRTFGTIRNPNIPEKTLPEKPKTKPSNHVTLKQQKPEPETKPVPKTATNDKSKLKKKKTVSFPETKITPGKDVVDGVKTPVRPPFSVKPIRIPGTPYLTAEKCSSCQFDRLETASYWLGQIKSAETVGKHFVSVAFFRLANLCKAEPARNLQIELKKYIARHDNLSTKAEWEDVSRLYGIVKKECATNKIKEDRVVNLFSEETDTPVGSKDCDKNNDQEQIIENEDDDWVKEMYE
uniref:uncharacterized protein LOC122605711 n=1 Tax=Erigeron canadensis TaxID=72917 RepID=UPI001CB8DA7A|nr:uncharacterized protein LOC122605711 [Erigeron canadensis]